MLFVPTCPYFPKGLCFPALGSVRPWEFQPLFSWILTKLRPPAFDRFKASGGFLHCGGCSRTAAPPVQSVQYSAIMTCRKIINVATCALWKMQEVCISCFHNGIISILTVFVNVRWPIAHWQKLLSMNYRRINLTILHLFKPSKGRHPWVKIRKRIFSNEPLFY